MSFSTRERHTGQATQEPLAWHPLPGPTRLNFRRKWCASNMAAHYWQERLTVQNDQGRPPFGKRPCCKKYRPISRVLFLSWTSQESFRHFSSSNIAIGIKQPTHYDNHRSERQRAVVRSQPIWFFNAWGLPKQLSPIASCALNTRFHLFPQQNCWG